MKNTFKGNKGKVVLIILVLGIYFLISPIKSNVNQAISVLKNVNADMVKEYVLSFGVLVLLYSNWNWSASCNNCLFLYWRNAYWYS
jgi:uncharacterized protein (UPF0333 family)